MGVNDRGPIAQVALGRVKMRRADEVEALGAGGRFDQTIVCLVTDFQSLEVEKFGLHLVLACLRLLDLDQERSDQALQCVASERVQLGHEFVSAESVGSSDPRAPSSLAIFAFGVRRSCAGVRPVPSRSAGTQAGAFSSGESVSAEPACPATSFQRPPSTTWGRGGRRRPGIRQLSVGQPVHKEKVSSFSRQDSFRSRRRLPQFVATFFQRRISDPRRRRWRFISRAFINMRYVQPNERQKIFCHWTAQHLLQNGASSPGVQSMQF